MNATSPNKRLSENDSEKKKRGRPSVFEPGEVARITSFFPDVQSGRGKQNIVYQQRALVALMDDERFYWIMGGSTQDISAGKCTIRQSILQALGRIPDREDMLIVAEKFCEIKPTARQAAAMVRRFLDTRRAPSVFALARVIGEAINDYTFRYPEMTRDKVLRALEIVADDVEGGDA